MSKNSMMLAWFSEYCREHPEERFWQALRNWSKSAFILRADGFSQATNNFYGIRDTFYEEHKNTTD